MTTIECESASQARVVAGKLVEAGMNAKARLVNGYRHEVRVRAVASTEALAALPLWLRRQVTVS